MKQVIYLIALFLFSFSVHSQDFVPLRHIERTFFISIGNSSGTCFMVKKNQNNYFVTAKHVLGNVTNNQKIDFYIQKDGKWWSQRGTVLLHSDPEIDIAVVEEESLSGYEAVPLDQISIYLGDEGFFWGFPFGLTSSDIGKINNGFPIPLVKKCVFSGSAKNGLVNKIYFDGNNNPGFSGGPIFFKNRNDPKDQNYYLVAVISGYRKQINERNTPNGKLEYDENSGIIIAYSSLHIIEILSQNQR